MTSQNTEAKRIQALKRYEVLDTPPDGTFNKLAELASKFFNVPIALISLVDADRIWFKSKYGLEDISEINRDPGLCASAILADDIYIVEDARNDPRCLSNPLVCGDFGLQFYAAAPLKTIDGHNLGTFCIIDKKQRFFNEEQMAMLKVFSAIVIDELELRLNARNIIKENELKIETLEKRLGRNQDKLN